MEFTKEEQESIDYATSESISKRKLPLWMLSPYEEKVMRQSLKTTIWKRCDEWVAHFVECSKSAGLRIFPKCDPQRAKLHDCLKYYQADEFVQEQIDLHIERKLKTMEEKFKEQQAEKEAEIKK